MARKNLLLGLKSLDVVGEIHHPAEYLVTLLETDEYIQNKIHTGWLDSLIANKTSRRKI